MPEITKTQAKHAKDVLLKYSKQEAKKAARKGGAKVLNAGEKAINSLRKKFKL